ncbi:MAG: imm11 family protein [Candidatus Oleimicrobiaceae bacterium]
MYLPHDDFLVSERFREIYERHGLTGLRGFDPVRIVKLKRRRRITEQPSPYYRVMAVRSQTVVDQEASGIEWSNDWPICPVCREGRFLKRWKRLVIETATWTGEDIFYARGVPGTIFVSERFKDVCETTGVRNAAFIPAEEQSREWCPWEIPDWEVRQFDETLAVLHIWNKGGRFDHFIDAMLELREHVVADQTFNWIEELRERFENIDAVGDAAAEAHYKLVGMRPPRRQPPRGPKRR